MVKHYGHGSLFNRLIPYILSFFLILQTDVALSTSAFGYGGEELSIISELPRRHPFMLKDGRHFQLAVIYEVVKVSGLKVKTSDHRWVYINKNDRVLGKYYEIPLDNYSEINTLLPHIDLKNPSKYVK
jgi:hypothetical protein